MYEHEITLLSRQCFLEEQCFQLFIVSLSVALLSSPGEDPVVALRGEVAAVGGLDGAAVGGREEGVAGQRVDEDAAAEQEAPRHDAEQPQDALPPLKYSDPLKFWYVVW